MVSALKATGAALAFDAVGGGKLAGQILNATRTISLLEALDPGVIAAYSRRATGEKFLINPSLAIE